MTLHAGATAYRDILPGASTRIRCRSRAPRRSNGTAARLWSSQSTASPGSRRAAPRSSCSCPASSPPNPHRLRRAFHVVFSLSPTSDKIRKCFDGRYFRSHLIEGLDEHSARLARWKLLLFLSFQLLVLGAEIVVN